MKQLPTVNISETADKAAVAVSNSLREFCYNAFSGIVFECVKPVSIKEYIRTTVVTWNDGTRTAVRCSSDTVPDGYAAFTAALAKKIYGSNTAVKNLMRQAFKNTEKDGE